MEITVPHDLVHRKIKAYLSEQLGRIDASQWSYGNMLYLKPRMQQLVDTLAEQAAFWYADENVHVCECCKRNYIYALPALETYLRSEACQRIADSIAWDLAKQYLQTHST